MDQVVQFILVLLKTIYLCIEASIKALLPMGILPRKDVKGQTVLITGSGNGIGRLMAIEFAKLGCVLVLWDINEKGNNETKEMVESAGVKVHTYTVNLAKKEEIYATAERVKKEVGNVDILINNAGVVTGKKLFDCPDELMELTMAVNTNALFFTGKAFIPSMLTNNRGHVVTIASIAGKVGVSGLVDYCSSKHGAIGFHESITNEIIYLKKDGVKTTVVCPFYIDTGMFDGAQTKSPTLLPILEPSYVVDNIIEGILTNREFVALPKFCYVVNAAMGIFPSSVCHLLAEYFGTNETMDNFTGRKQKQ